MGRRSARLDRWTRPVALFLVLAITTGWTPSSPNAAAMPAGAAAAAAGAGVATGRIAGDQTSFAGDRADSGFTAAIAFQERSAARHDRPVVQRPERAGGRPAVTLQSEAKAKLKAKPRATAQAARRPSYTGTNHFWMPSLGMSYRVHLYECSRTRPPDNYLYRWGCAGTNNVYLLGHAYSVMKPLHDAYVSGRLKVGMVAIYANGNGKVTYYKVTQWRVVDPVDSEWAIASQRVPSMTLQTCVGKDSRYRLNVRLVAYK